MNPGAAVMLAEENATGVYADIEQFPEGYRPALEALKQKHPNWTFVRQNTGLDFQTVINNELQGGKSLVYKSYRGLLQGRTAQPQLVFRFGRCTEIIHGPQKFPAGECYFPV